MAKDSYEPEEIQETPFPGEPILSALPSPKNPAGTFTPTISKEKAFPKKRAAVELLSTALNTRSRKILEEFKLHQSGGLKVGDFKEGVSGDLRITPNGITARDTAGVTTFAIDGADGSAVFKGEIRSGSLVTGSVEVTDGNIELYNNGILEIFIGNDGT